MHFFMGGVKHYSETLIQKAKSTEIAQANSL